MATDRQYTGQREEAGLGLYDYNARYYDGALGRFIQADTIVPEPGNPQSLNRYAYTYNNPLKYTDPSGHFALTALLGTAAIGGLVNLAVDYVVTTQVMHEDYSVEKGVLAFGVGAVGSLIGGALVPKVAQGVGTAVMAKVAASTASKTTGALAGLAAQITTDLALSSANNVVMNSVQRLGSDWMDNGDQITGQMIADDLSQHAARDAGYGAGASFVGQTWDFLGSAYLPNPSKGGDIVLTPGQPGLAPRVEPSFDGLTLIGKRQLATRNTFYLLGNILSDDSTLEFLDTVLPGGGSTQSGSQAY